MSLEKRKEERKGRERVEKGKGKGGRKEGEGGKEMKKKFSPFFLSKPIENYIQKLFCKAHINLIV